MEENKRYGDADLAEFKAIIMEKLNSAKAELGKLQQQLANPNENGIEQQHYITMEDGALTFEKENLNQLAARQQKFINNLEAALIRIENKTYGICRETGKLISKERLKAVPHTTLSIEAKNNQYK
ncbi:MAG: TraR/DksA C4-type zinc finger protein [Bacteroidia bacterium]|nr:TraR/DksA C4-type zinc finger protein [Bacteroidia bacterium]